MELLDIGLNLTHRSFERDRDAVLERAITAGVTQMVLTGTSEKGSAAALELARTRPGTLYATAGVHPHHALDFSPRTLEVLTDLAADKTVVAVGECGLDFNRNFSPPEDQERCFNAHIALAGRVGKPLFMHERDAAKRFLEIIGPQRHSFGHGVVHCFTGDAEALHAYLDLDLHIGITGWICDERRGKHLLELVRQIPLDRLMLETDAPFITPRNMGFKPEKGRNEPAFLPHVLRTVAGARDEDLATIAGATTRTARMFFGLDDEMGCK